MARKAANGSGSLRKRSDGSWEARITIGTDSGTGRPVRKSIYGRTQQEVRQKLTEITKSIDDGNYLEPSKLTVRGWFQIWLKDFQTEVKPLTKRQYESMAEVHIFPAIGNIKLSKLSTMQLTRFYNELAISGKKQRRKNPQTGKMEIVETGEPLSPKTISNVHAIISKALNTAIENRILKENVATYAKVPKVVRKEVKPLTEDQQKSFLKVIKNHPFKNIYTVILFTGLREAEACGLTWDCFDEKKGTLKIYRQLQRDPEQWSNFRFVPLKNSKTRTIKLSPYVVEILRKQRIEQTKQRLKAGELWQGWQNEKERETWYIFTNESGRYLNSATVYENFKKIVSEIGIPEARLHDMRHTYAVVSLQNGDDFKTLQENLGHSSATTTLNVYAHVSEKMKEESARRQQEYIKSLGLQA